MTVFYLLLFIVNVRVLSLDVLNSTSVRVSWTPVNLTVAYHYTVHYTTVGEVNGTVTFPGDASSGVVSGLQRGQQYQFSVTVTLNISGELYTGSPDDSIPLISCMYIVCCIRLRTLCILWSAWCVVFSVNFSNLIFTTVPMIATTSKSCLKLL